MAEVSLAGHMTPLTPAERRRGMAGVIAAISVTGIMMGLTLPLLALLLEDMGASSTLIGLNTAMSAVAVLLITPLVPWLVRKVGATMLWMVSIVMAIGCLLLFKAIPIVWVWFPLRLLLGVALTGLFTTSEFWVNSLTDDEHRGRVLGMYAACLSAGFAIGPTILPVTGIHGWAPFLTGAGIAALASIPLWLTRSVAPRIDEGPSRSVFAFVLVAPLATLAALVYGAVEAGLFVLLPVYGVHSAMSPETAALMLAAVGAGNVLCQLPIGWLADRMDRRWLLVGCALTGVAGAGSLPLVVNTPALLWPSLFVWGGVVVGMYTVGLSLLGQRFKGADLAAANAAFVLMYGVGSLVGPPIAGASMDRWDPHGLAVAMSAICGAYVIVAVLKIVTGSRPSCG